MKRILISAIVLWIGATGLATADVVTLVDHSTFANIAVDNVECVAGNATILARELAEGLPAGEPRPLDAARIEKIEFRGAGDMAARPAGRLAAMTMANGNRFDAVWVESCTRTPAGQLVFQVREARVSPGGVAFPVDSPQLASLLFQPYTSASPSAGYEFAPDNPSVAPAEEASNSQLDPPSAPPAYSQPIGLENAQVAVPVSNTAPARVEPAPAPVATTDAAASVSAPPETVPPQPPPDMAASFPSDGTLPSLDSLPVGKSDPGNPSPRGASTVSTADNLPGGRKQWAALQPSEVPNSDTVGNVLSPAQVTVDRLRQRVTVVGELIRFRASWATRAPNILTLGKDGVTVDAVYWDAVDVSLGERINDLTTVGAVVQVAGDLEEYKGSLQIRVGDAADLVLVSKKPESLPPETRLPSQISDQDQGREVLLKGTVDSLVPSSQENVPTRVVVSDPNGGSITVVFWNDPFGNRIGAQPPRIGKDWEVPGKVQLNHGELQIRAIQPDSAG